VTFLEQNRAWDLIEAVDRIWDRWQEHPSDASLLVSTFLRARGRGAFRAAMRLAAAGQPVEAFSLCRSVLEHACYAAHAAWEPGASKVWNDRMESEGARAAARSTFGWTAVLASIGARNSDLRGEIKSIYDDLIDQGAHPNPDATYGSMGKPEIMAPGTLRFELGMLVPQGPQWLLGLTQVYRSGRLAHEVFGLIWPNAYSGRIETALRSIKLSGEGRTS
jgi:hypothetical protein